jgi:hypothetical protein
VLVPALKVPFTVSGVEAARVRVKLLAFKVVEGSIVRLLTVTFWSRVRLTWSTASSMAAGGVEVGGEVEFEQPDHLAVLQFIPTTG